MTAEYYMPNNSTERPESNELLKFYAALLRSQKDVYEYLRTRKNWLPACGLRRRSAVTDYRERAVEIIERGEVDSKRGDSAKEMHRR